MAQKLKLIEINPFDSEDIKQIEELELLNKTLNLSAKLKETSQIEEDKYMQKKRKSNTIDEVFALKERDRIKGLFSITGEKDIRSCLITIHYVNQCQPKTLISIGTTHALNTMRMQEIFVKISSTDKSTRKYLEDSGYEYLDEESGQIIYLKDESIPKYNDNIIAYS